MNQNDKEQVRKEISSNLFKEYKHLLSELRVENKKHLIEADEFIAEQKQRIEYPSGVATG